MLKIVMPDRLFDIKAFEREVSAALDETAKDVQAEFAKTTTEWETAVTFTTDKPNDATRVISTDNEIYGYVNNGTRPHVITAKTSKGLVFGVGGSPKTQPGVVGSSRGRRGNQIVRAQSVNHPGSEARNFDKAIAEAIQPTFSQRIERAVKRNIGS